MADRIGYVFPMNGKFQDAADITAYFKDTHSLDVEVTVGYKNHDSGLWDDILVTLESTDEAKMESILDAAKIYISELESVTKVEAAVTTMRTLEIKKRFDVNGALKAAIKE